MNAILFLETYVGWEIVIKKYYRPARLVTLLEWSKSVRRKTEGNVAFVLEIEKGMVLVRRDNSVEEGLIMVTIKNILDNSRLVDIIRSIAHFFCKAGIC